MEIRNFNSIHIDAVIGKSSGQIKFEVETLLKFCLGLNM